MLQCAVEQGSGQAFVNAVYSLLGLPTHPEKHQEAASRLVHLGVVSDFSCVADDVAMLAPKPGRVEALLCKLRNCLLTTFCLVLLRAVCVAI